MKNFSYEKVHPSRLQIGILKKHIQTGLVTEKPSIDDNQRNISLSREEVQWFLENYYINLLVVADRNYVEDNKETVSTVI